MNNQDARAFAKRLRLNFWFVRIRKDGSKKLHWAEVRPGITVEDRFGDCGEWVDNDNEKLCLWKALVKLNDRLNAVGQELYEERHAKPDKSLDHYMD